MIQLGIKAFTLKLIKTTDGCVCGGGRGRERVKGTRVCVKF